MGFSLGGFLKKALNPLAPFQTMKRGIDQARSGDWKGALKTSMIGGLTPGGITPDAPQGGMQAFAKGGGGEPQAFEQAPQMASMKGGPMGAGIGGFMRGIGAGSTGRAFPRMGGSGMAGGFMGGSMGGGMRGGMGRGGGFSMGGGGMDEGLMKIIQDYFSKQRGGGGGQMSGGGGFSQFGG